MFQCHVCGSTQAQSDFTDEVFLIEGKRVLVEHIPVTRCARCGEITVSRETTERVQRLAHNIAQPVKTVPLAVLTELVQTTIIPNATVGVKSQTYCLIGNRCFNWAKGNY